MLKVVKSLPAKCDNCGKLKVSKDYHRYPNGRRHRNCIACEEAKAEREPERLKFLRTLPVYEPAGSEDVTQH